jgi:hypothetical protein
LEPDSGYDWQYARALDVLAEPNIPVVYYPDLNEYPGPARAYYMIATACPSVKLLNLAEQSEALIPGRSMQDLSG